LPSRSFVFHAAGAMLPIKYWLMRLLSVEDVKQGGSKLEHQSLPSAGFDLWG
jgi:hypothetical protein